MAAETEDKKAAGVCLDAVKMPEENYRLGHTKVRGQIFFIYITVHNQSWQFDHSKRLVCH